MPYNANNPFFEPAKKRHKHQDADQAVATVLPHGLRRDEAELGQKVNQHRQFED